MGNETVAVYDPRLLDDIPAWVIENIQAVSMYMKTRGHEEWTIAGVRSQAAHAREVEALRLRAEAAEASMSFMRDVFTDGPDIVKSLRKMRASAPAHDAYWLLEAATHIEAIDAAISAEREG